MKKYYDNLLDTLEVVIIVFNKSFEIIDYNKAASKVVQEESSIIDIVNDSYLPIIKNGVDNRFPFKISEKKTIRKSIFITTDHSYKLIVKPFEEDIFIMECMEVGSLRKTNNYLLMKNREFIKHSGILTELISIKSGKNNINSLNMNDIVHLYEEQLKLQFSMDDALGNIIEPIISGEVSTHIAADIILNEIRSIVKCEAGIIFLKSEIDNNFDIISKFDEGNIISNIGDKIFLYDCIAEFDVACYYNENDIFPNKFSKGEEYNDKYKNIMIIPLLYDEVKIGELILINAYPKFTEMHFKIALRLGQLFLIACQRIKHLNQLEGKANKDTLTGCYNRRAGLAMLEKTYKECSSTNKTFILMFIDINGLKKVNDELGHNVGDELIKTFADIIHRVIRDSDMFFRYGGDEFVLILPNFDKHYTDKFINRINDNIDEFNNAKEKSFNVSISLGYVEYSKNKNLTVSQLIEKADQLMYRNKYKNKQGEFEMLKIIHVDDSGFQRRICNKIIKGAYSNLEYKSYSDYEFLEKVNNNETFADIDIVFTDLVMNVISGHEIIKHIKKVNENCCKVVITSNIQSTEKTKCYENGTDYFIEKPLTKEKIEEFKEFYNEKFR